MKLNRRGLFIVRSLVWSLILYALVMLTLNRDEIGRAMNGKDKVTIIVANEQPATTNINHEPEVIVNVVKALLVLIP